MWAGSLFFLWDVNVQGNWALPESLLWCSISRCRVPGSLRSWRMKRAAGRCIACLGKTRASQFKHEEYVLLTIMYHMPLLSQLFSIKQRAFLSKTRAWCNVFLDVPPMHHVVYTNLTCTQILHTSEPNPFGVEPSVWSHLSAASFASNRGPTVADPRCNGVEK